MLSRPIVSHPIQGWELVVIHLEETAILGKAAKDIDPRRMNDLGGENSNGDRTRAKFTAFTLNVRCDH